MDLWRLNVVCARTYGRTSQKTEYMQLPPTLNKRPLFAYKKFHLTGQFNNLLLALKFRQSTNYLNWSFTSCHNILSSSKN